MARPEVRRQGRRRDKKQYDCPSCREGYLKRTTVILAAILVAACTALKPLAQVVATPQAPPEPAGWLDRLREGTISIGQVKEVEISIGNTKTKKRMFVPVGTGLAVHEDSKALWLVTAKHVFDDDTATPPWHPDTVQLRFSWFDDKPVDEYFGVTIDLKKNGKPLWTAHREADLACIPLVVNSAEIGRRTMLSVSGSEFASSKDYYAGTSVIVLGYPGAVGQEFWNRALARQGMIAWVSPTDPDKRPFLVDGNIFHGNSGGPVFRAPISLSELGAMSGTTTVFLGLVSQGRGENVPVTLGGKTMQITLPPEGPGKEAKQVPVLSANLIGIGVIEPASRVLEVLRAAGATITGR